MFNPNPLAEVHKRLATVQREYEAAHARTVSLESELFAAQAEISRLQPAEPGREALQPPVTLGACYSCGRAVALSKKQWVGNCRRCGTTLHPRRHGELRAGCWEHSVSVEMDECSYQDKWYWKVGYRAPYEEHPPQGNIYLRLQGELGQSLGVEGYTWSLVETDRHATSRLIHWAGSVHQDVRAAQDWATRAFVAARLF